MLPLIMFALVVPTVAAAQGIPDRVAELEARLLALEAGPQPTQVNVDCDAGGSVQAVLDQYRWHPGGLTVRVSGTCWEHIVVSRDDVAILALSAGAGFRTASTAASLVSVRGASRVQLFDVTLRGGQNALNVVSGAAVLALRVNVSGASYGVQVADSVIELRNATVESNTVGVAAQSGAQVTVRESSIRNNGFHGVSATDASVRIRQSVVEQNQGSGVHAWVGARIGVLSSTIRDNLGGGIGLQSATLSVEGDATAGPSIISGNGAGGIGMYHGSSANLRGVTIESNTQSGIGVTGGSTVLIGSNTNIIRNNVGPGIRLNDTSTAGRFNEAILEITGNQSGIRCQAAPGVAQIVGGPAGYAITLAHVFGNGGVKQIDCPGF